MIFFSHLVEVPFLSTKLNVSKDRKVESVDGGDASAAGVVRVSTRWVIDVVL